MAKYIDAEKLIAKIKSVRQDWLGNSTGLEVGESAAELGAAECILDSIDDIIDSLQENQPIDKNTLTWKDINDLERIINNVHYEFRNGIGEKSFGEEVLERFMEERDEQEQPEGGCSEKPNDLLSEWTEEDERTRWNLCSLLTNLRVGKKIEESTFKKYYSWLKIIHIKPRKTSKQAQPEDIVVIAKTFLDALSKTPYNNKPITDAQIIVKQLLLFLETPSKYNPDAIVELPEVDLEEEIVKYFQGYWPGMKTPEACNHHLVFTPPAIMKMAKHFYELGLNARKEE